MVKEGCHLYEHLGLGTRLRVECDVRGWGAVASWLSFTAVGGGGWREVRTKYGAPN